MTEQERSFKSFGDMARALRQQAPTTYLLPHLRFGDVYWIPNCNSRLQGDGLHPWVVISPFRPGAASVVACLRTSSRTLSKGEPGVVLPAQVIDGLDREGPVIIMSARSFQVPQFADWEYVGRLPQPWRQRLFDVLPAARQRAVRPEDLDD